MAKRGKTETAGSPRLGVRPLPKGERMVRYSAKDLLDRKPSSNWAAVDALTDEDMARAVANDPDAAPLDVDWSKFKVRVPAATIAISLRIAPDVLGFFRSKGKRYQTPMNAVLRAHVEFEKAKERRGDAP
jgi:uncharacterized protein (DUF4415 family)